MTKEDLLHVISQLRHAYAQLSAGSVIDQKQFAEGLIAPQIRMLEELNADDDKQVKTYTNFVEACKNPRPPTQKLIDLMRQYGRFAK